MLANEELAQVCSAASPAHLSMCFLRGAGGNRVPQGFCHSSSHESLLALVYRWLAPEVVTHQQYSKASDVYSFGVILWELLTWKLPWENLGPFQVSRRVYSLPGCCDKNFEDGKLLVDCLAHFRAHVERRQAQVSSRQVSSSSRPLWQHLGLYCFRHLSK